MALFSRKNKKEVVSADAPAVPVGVAVGGGQNLAHVLRAPRITEKASMAMEDFVYVFDIAPNANKREVSAAIQAVYKVKPRKVAIVNTPAKAVRNARTGQSGMKSGSKKAYVYLQKGETITIA